MFVLLLCCLAVAAHGAAVSTRSYAVIFDCGSTGTRVHTFSWGTEASVGGMPDVVAEPGGYKKVTPGISSFETSPEAAGGSIVPLVELAERVVPASEHARTLVLLRATAGMRLISRRRAQRIYTSLYNAVIARGTFQPRREDFGTLSGEDEGVFGWLCANYLLARSGQIKSIGSIGALDLGGGSTQITLATGAHANDHSQIDPRTITDLRPPSTAPNPRVSLPQGDVSVFTHSHLGWGNKAVLAALTSSEAAACLAAGASASWEPSNKSSEYHSYLNRGAGVGAYIIRGRGDFDACDEAVRRVLGTFDRAGQPTLRSGAPSRFIAMSLFFYVEHFVEVAGYLSDGAPHAPSHKGAAHGAGGSRVSASQLLAAARRLCAEPDSSLRRMLDRDPLTNEDALRWRCFDATYASRLLTEGYGFAPDDAVVEFRGEISGVEVEWTLGALLNQLLTKGAAHPAKPHRPALPTVDHEASSPPLFAPILIVVGAALGILVARRYWCGHGIPRNGAIRVPQTDKDWA